MRPALLPLRSLLPVKADMWPILAAETEPQRRTMRATLRSCSSGDRTRFLSTRSATTSCLTRSTTLASGATSARSEWGFPAFCLDCGSTDGTEIFLHSTKTRGCDLIAEVNATEAYSSPRSTTGRQRTSPVVSGVIGALVALVVAALAFTALEVYRNKKRPARAAQTGKGDSVSAPFPDVDRRETDQLAILFYSHRRMSSTAEDPSTTPSTTPSCSTRNCSPCFISTLLRRPYESLHVPVHTACSSCPSISCFYHSPSLSTLCVTLPCLVSFPACSNSR